ncbi:MAG: kelch repeat-containing protein [bacterium]
MKNKILGIIAVTIYLAATTQVLALDLEWKTKAPMPTARDSLAAAVLNGKIYAIGGQEGEGGKKLNVVEEFDPSIGPNGTWTTKAPMPTGRYFLAAATLNGKIYAM